MHACKGPNQFVVGPRLVVLQRMIDWASDPGQPAWTGRNCRPDPFRKVGFGHWVLRR